MRNARKGLINKLVNLRLSSIFLLASLFYAFFAVFGVYSYTIYSMSAFVMFYVYELLFYLGLRSGGIVLHTNQRKSRKTFEITHNGALVLLALNGVAVLCFLYFFYLYVRSVGFTFGSFTADLFGDEGRTTLEKFTLMLMQIGSNAVFLVVSCDKTKRYRVLRLTSAICHFLPGIRALLLGNRFTIAMEFMVFVILKWDTITNGAKKVWKNKRRKRMLIAAALLLFAAFMYLFATRMIYYTALERYEFVPGDMVMRPFWKWLYDLTNGAISPLCSLSDYMAEAPFVASYFLEYHEPTGIAYGQLTFRSVFQILRNLLRLFGIEIGEVSIGMRGGRYSGMIYTMIGDFGVYLAPFFAYLFGLVFAKVERARSRNKVCCAIYPALQTLCFFAPLVYFTAGRLDYAILYTILLSMLCLRNVREQTNDFQ